MENRNFNIRMYYYFILILTLAISSCSKTDNPTGGQDSILYKYLDPSPGYSTVLSFTQEEIGDCSTDIPFPEDSVVTFGIDINDDQENDFIIDVSHNRLQGEHECLPCSVFEYQISISGSNENNFVSNNPYYSWEPAWYELNDTIRPTDSWHKEIFISMQGGCDRVTVTLRDAYVGIKHDNSYGYIHVRPLPNNGIEIIEHALNLSAGRSIYAGQKN